MRRMGFTETMEGIGKAAEITQIVQAAGLPVSLWVGGPGAIPGTVVWSVPVESFAEWAGYSDTLAADAAYAEFASKNVGTITLTAADSLSEVVYGTVEGRSEVGEYIGSMTAVVQPDRAVDAAAFAAEIADAYAATTGLQAVVMKNLAGDQSTIEWIVRHGTAEAVDEAEAKTAASADYAAVLAKGSGLFSAANRLFARRVA